MSGESYACSSGKHTCCNYSECECSCHTPKPKVKTEFEWDWQRRERELLARNTELVEKLREAQYVEQKALEFGARQEKRAEEAEAQLVAFETAAWAILGALDGVMPDYVYLTTCKKRLTEVLKKRLETKPKKEN